MRQSAAACIPAKACANSGTNGNEAMPARLPSTSRRVSIFIAFLLARPNMRWRGFLIYVNRDCVVTRMNDKDGFLPRRRMHMHGRVIGKADRFSGYSKKIGVQFCIAVQVVKRLDRVLTGWKICERGDRSAILDFEFCGSRCCLGCSPGGLIGGLAIVDSQHYRTLGSLQPDEVHG